jgi:dihydroorotate dehydrogenase
MKLIIKLFGKNVFVAGSKYEKKTDLINYYLMNISCHNCKEGTNIYIKKGVHLNDIITAVKCRNCDCRLEKQENK